MCVSVRVPFLHMHVLVYAYGTNACVSVHAYACTRTPVCVCGHMHVLVESRCENHHLLTVSSLWGRDELTAAAFCHCFA